MTNKQKIKKRKSFKKPVLIFIAVLLAVSAFGIVYRNAVQFRDDGINMVCLDAGHGGGDSGAVSTDETRLEKDDNLALALKLKEKLEAQGVTVVLTREDDSDVSLKERCKIANRKHCDLFVSLHRNSAGSSADGVEAWISTTAGIKESRVAKAAVENICSATGQNNRGVKRGYRGNAIGNYYTNSKTLMPSLLLEVGFISNDSDNEIFDTKLDECASAISDAIMDTFF